MMEAAAAFLGVRPRSVAETRRRLRHLGYREPLVDEVIDRLVAMRYLDDEQFARTWVEGRDRARPRGESALRRELALKGVAREVVDDVLLERAAESSSGTPTDGADDGDGGSEPGSADRRAAERLLERRRRALAREPDERRRRQKAYALLARNGFDPEVCREVVARIDGPVED